jgi:hypothetical protein
MQGSAPDSCGVCKLPNCLQQHIGGCCQGENTADERIYDQVNGHHHNTKTSARLYGFLSGVLHCSLCAVRTTGH